MKNLAFLPLLLCAFAMYGQIKLSPRAEISVVTCGPSQLELYTAFGHSAIHVSDPGNGIDHIFNYGVFDFDQPNFYLNFARGKNMYVLAVQDWPRFRDTYIYYNRFIHEQILNLTAGQKQKIFDYLYWNSRPENRGYYYDYFYDNCATRIRDVAENSFGDSVKFDMSYITTDYTIRDLTDLYLKDQPWGDLGIDICLGMPMDKKASPYMYMFLPDYIETAYDHATINHNGTEVPLVKRKISVFESKPDEESGTTLPHPLVVFGILALIVFAITIYDFIRKKLSTWLDVILFGLTGLIGMVLLLLWVATDHKAAANNFNLLWALPTNLVAAVLLYRNPKWLTRYFQVVAELTALLLMAWAFLPQQLNYFLLPVVGAILARAFVQFWLRRPVKS